MKSGFIIFLTSVSLASTTQAASLLLFRDDFDGTGINTDLATRQEGSLSPANWNTYFGGLPGITSNQMRSTNDGIFNQANLLASLTNPDPDITGFVVNFDAQHLSGTSNWISPFLSTHEGGADDRGATQFGLLIFGTGGVSAYKNNGGVQGTVDLSNAQVTSAVGVTWDPNNLNSYSLVATRTTTLSGTYDVFINNVQVFSDVSYAFSATGAAVKTGYTGLYWANRDAATNSAYDNLEITVIPEPASLSLVGLGGMLLLLRRRRA